MFGPRKPRFEVPNETFSFGFASFHAQSPMLAALGIVFSLLPSYAQLSRLVVTASASALRDQRRYAKDMVTTENLKTQLENTSPHSRMHHKKYSTNQNQLLGEQDESSVHKAA